MNRTPLLLALAGLAGLTGCSHSDDNGPAGTTPTRAEAVDFTTFVSAQYTATATSETASPVQFQETNFTFADDSNPDAFNTVIATAP